MQLIPIPESTLWVPNKTKITKLSLITVGLCFGLISTAHEGSFTRESGRGKHTVFMCLCYAD